MASLLLAGLFKKPNVKSLKYDIRHILSPRYLMSGSAQVDYSVLLINGA
ncbi:MAG: hypothetical protein HRT44_09840, partial [Bdellovibrionales bacterium]|nr:hypothetical protein [Bdellovibrionales bacterium]